MPRSADTPRDAILDEVFEKKTKADIARACKVSKVAVGLWRRVPDAHVRVVAGETGISLKRLRPDLYDPDFKRATATA